jgi:hypothetical protein
MATDRQIATNRQNARRSSGPRSQAGKSRASRNRYRHGLSASPPTTAKGSGRLDKLAREIAGKTDAAILTRARAIAEAQLELARVRQTKVELLKCVHALGGLRPLLPFESPREVLRDPRDYKRPLVTNKPAELDAAAPMPKNEPARTSEAVRRALPDLLTLDRYEHLQLDETAPFAISSPLRSLRNFSGSF